MQQLDTFYALSVFTVKVLCQPHTEYCVQAWSPYLVKDSQCLEKAQTPEEGHYDGQGA